MQDIYKNIEEYNIGKERRIKLVFEDMITDMINNDNEKLISLVTELFIMSKKFNISLFLLDNHCSECQKMLVQIPPTFYFENSRLKRTSTNCIIHETSILKDFISVYIKCTAEPYSHLVNNAMVASDNALKAHSKVWDNFWQVKAL